MLVASYVNGFRQYDTTVVGDENFASIGVYIDREGQTREGAEALSSRFREQATKSLEVP